jgi:tetrahydrodipicolinate N-succinyltransferase
MAPVTILEYDPVAVLGGGPHGHEIARLLGPDALVFDDSLDGYRPCLAGARLFEWVVGAFWPEIRMAIAEKVYAARRDDHVHNRPRRSGNVFHPTAVVPDSAQVSTHDYVGPHAVLSHGCYLSDFVSIAAGVALGGDVEVRRGVVLGANATVIHGGVIIGEDAFVAAGAVVIDDVPPGAVVAGNPAKIIAHEWNHQDMARGRRGRARLASP